MDSGGELTVLAKNESNSIEIQISDTRYGPPGDPLRELHDPFRLSKPIGETSSLDLSICHNIIQHHRGEFQIMNNKRQGITFILRFTANLP